MTPLEDKLIQLLSNENLITFPSSISPEALAADMRASMEIYIKANAQ